jgi:hypothetical protein
MFVNLAAFNMEENISTVCFSDWDVWEQQLLRPCIA